MLDVATVLPALIEVITAAIREARESPVYALDRAASLDTAPAGEARAHATQLESLRSTL